MLFGMQPGSLCSPTHQIIRRLLKSPLCRCRPGHDVQTRRAWCWFFLHFFVRCKFLRAGFDDLCGGDPAVWCPELVNPNLIWYARSDPKLWSARGQRCQVWRVERAAFICERSGTVATLDTFWPLSINYCEDEVWFVNGASEPNVSWESNTNLSPGMQGNWRNVWNFHVFLGEALKQFIRWKLHDNTEHINQILAGINIQLSFVSLGLSMIVFLIKPLPSLNLRTT